MPALKQSHWKWVRIMCRMGKWSIWN